MLPEILVSAISARVRLHTAYTVVGGVVLVPVLLTFLSVFSPAKYRSVQDTIEVSLFVIGIGLLPAWLFALLRQPPMRWVFRQALLTVARWRRLLLLTGGTAAVFLAYVAGATLLVAGFVTLAGNGPFGVVLHLYSLAMFGFGLPWLLAAVASACYVNRDLLRRSYTPPLTLRKRGS